MEIRQPDRSDLVRYRSSRIPWSKKTSHLVYIVYGKAIHLMPIDPINTSRWARQITDLDLLTEIVHGVCHLAQVDWTQFQFYLAFDNKFYVDKPKDYMAIYHLVMAKSANAEVVGSKLVHSGDRIDYDEGYQMLKAANVLSADQMQLIESSMQAS